MITIRVTYADGNHIDTGFNGSLADAQRYYIGQSFNFGDRFEGDPDNMVKATGVEVLTAYPLDNAPYCQPGMGVAAAQHSGWVHGYQDKVTTGVCTLTKGTPEYNAWMEYYAIGERYRAEVDGRQLETKGTKA